jgi:hypothetical protein
LISRKTRAIVMVRIHRLKFRVLKWKTKIVNRKT